MEIIFDIAMYLFVFIGLMAVLFTFNLVLGKWTEDNPPQTGPEMFLRKK